MTKGVDMHNNKQLFQAALELIIDGVSLSEQSSLSRQAGVYLAGLVIADMKGDIDAAKQQAINDIIMMAAEIDTDN